VAQRPVPAVQKDGLLYGRGAADMKASLAAFVTAAEAFVAARPAHGGSLAFLLTSDEEGDAVDGTVVVTDALQRRGELLDYCIVGEPTAVHRLGDMVKNGRRGSLSGRLTVKGIQGHIAYPHLAKNPIHLLAPAIATLAAMVWDDGNDVLSADHLAGLEHPRRHRRRQRHPGSVDHRFQLPLWHRQHPAATAATLCDVLDRRRPGLRHRLDAGRQALPHRPRRLIDAALQAIAAETGIDAELSTSGGTSDGRFIAAICPQVLEIGPVNATIHKVNECVEMAALPQLAAIYRRIIEQLLPGHA
jgi:succinyl-diaminopimelate desuccinylase